MVRAAQVATEAPTGTAPAARLEMECRMCELETENKRLRVLVGELLVENQQLREENKTIRAAQELSFDGSLFA